MKTCTLIASTLAAAAIAAAADADFAVGNQVAINASFGPGAGNDLGTFGTFAGQGYHSLGGQSTYWDTNDAPFAYTVNVTSTVVNQWSVMFSMDFSNFAPAYYSNYTIDIVGLKTDGSLLGVQGNSNGFNTDGNSVTWSGTGAELQGLGSLTFKVYQTPAPGALALVGMAGVVGSRRRRA
ncbi:MAG: hypothetical protein U0636_06550 [Phycisphaerales bacterium]